jgi:predicted nucleotidyltransferase component of viral defense system
MDVDTTFKNYPLSLETVTETINEIIAIPVDDGVSFQIKSVDNILDESEYGGIRAILEATLETMRTQLKLDITTGDVITPHEISYDFKLMFEERTISILAYNLETVLAEKLETVISRQIANTRMRDFYDLYILQNYQSHNIDMRLLSKALKNTTHKRESEIAMQNSVAILADIQKSSDMKKLWGNYGQKFDYAKDITWDSVIESIKTLLDNINVNPHTS